MEEGIIKRVRNCQNCNLCNLEINKVKPLDSSRISRKIMIVGQNPSENREASEKIFEYDNVSDRVMNEFLLKLGLTRDNVYFTNLVKCSTANNETPSKDCVDKCLELFYEEVREIKPLCIIFISKSFFKFVDIKQLKIPVISLSHPSYYFRNCGNDKKSAQLMYEDLFCYINSSLSYEMKWNFETMQTEFRDESSILKFFKLCNSLKIYNISLDGYYKTVATFVSNKEIFRIELRYHNYCYMKCKEGEVGEKVSLHGEPVKRFYYDNYKELPDDVLEKDIHSDYRFIIDFYNYLTPPKKEEVNYLTFDIETNGSVDVINTPKEITSIVYLLNDKIEFLMLDNNRNNFESLKNKSDCKIFKSEKTMVSYFMTVMRSSNLVTGFNISGFDIIYLINRAKVLGLNENDYSPLKLIKNKVIEEKDRLDERNITIYGLDVIDTMLYAKDKYFIYSLDKPSQYNLDYLGNFIKDKSGNSLGRKVYDSRGPATLWLEDPEKLYEYNIQDVVLCRKIEEYLGMVNYLFSFKELMSTFNIKWSLYNSKIIDFFILCSYSNKYAFPSKKDNPDEKLKGAYVKEPIPGIYPNLAVFDFSSLYPNIIRNFNLSYETISDNKDSFNNYTKIYDDSKKLHYYIDKDKKGLLPEVVDKIMFMKENISKSMKTSDDPTLPVKYNAIKAVINGIYGVFAYRYFRMYDIRIARAITAVGRKLTTSTMDYIDSLNYVKSIYGDTDSIFVWLKEKVEYFKAKDKLEEVLLLVNDNINKVLLECYNIENKYLKLEFETLFFKALQANAKKKYYGMGYFVKGKTFDYLKEYGRGIDMVKKDTPVSLRPLLKKMLIDIINNNGDEDIKNAINTVKKSIYSLSFRDLLITKQISRELDEYKNIPQHVKAMKYSNEFLGYNFSRMNYKGGMLYVTVISKYQPAEVIMLHEHSELPPEIKVNYKKYFELFVENKVSLLIPGFDRYFSPNKSLFDFGNSIQLLNSQQNHSLQGSSDC